MGCVNSVVQMYVVYVSGDKRKMKIERTIFVMVTLTTMLALTGCGSTLFYPSGSAEKAADKVIDDIWPNVVKPAAAKTETKTP